jgi:glycosyltransferase involved in cell wall biosynthesis
MTKKKLFCIDQGEYLGGAERFFSELLSSVHQEYEIHLITGDNGEYKNRYQDTEIKIHSIQIPPLKPYGVKSLKNLKKCQQQISKLVEQIQPDAMISNTVRTHIISSTIAKKKGIPLLWMAHDLTFPKALLRWFLRYPKTILSCSRYVADYYLPNHTNKVAKELLYPYGVHKEALEKIAIQRKEPIIGMIGKFTPWKGQDLFIQMAAKLHQDFPGVQFIIIGDIYPGDEESHDYYQKCMEMIKEKGLENTLQVHKSNDVLSEIASWEVLVHCSRDPEPLGRVILEGMTAGCAVVASDLGGPREIVHDSENGILCKPSLAQLVRTVGNLITNDDRRHKLQQTGKQWIRDHFMWKSTRERFMKIIEEL